MSATCTPLLQPLVLFHMSMKCPGSPHTLAFQCSRCSRVPVFSMFPTPQYLLCSKTQPGCRQGGGCDTNPSQTPKVPACHSYSMTSCLGEDHNCLWMRTGKYGLYVPESPCMLAPFWSHTRGITWSGSTRKLLSLCWLHSWQTFLYCSGPSGISLHWKGTDWLILWHRLFWSSINLYHLE